MAIILPLHCHYSVDAHRSGGSVGSSHLRVPQWLQCGGPIFSAANALLLLRCDQTTQPVFYLTFFRTASRSFLLGQKLWTLINHSGITTRSLYFFFFLSLWIMLGWALPLLTFSCVLPPVAVKQRWQALYVTERGGCHQSSSIKTFVISPVSEGMFPGFTAAFMTSSLITSQRNESQGNELIRVPVTNTIFVCCCQVCRDATEKQKYARRNGASLIFR